MADPIDDQVETGRAAANANSIVLNRRPVSRTLSRLTVSTIFIWLILFASGLLIETIQHRFILAPITTLQHLSSETIAQLGQEESELIKKIVAQANQEDRGVKIESIEGALPKSGEPDDHPFTYNPIRSFLVATFCFTPINLAFLSIVSGFLGGLASNILIETMPEKLEEIEGQLGDYVKQRRLYLQEPPVTSAIRGFVVYLCVIAGLYVAIDDPFKIPTAGQYVRLAGMLSVMAYLVGYDPSRLDGWLRLVPAPSSDSTTDSQQPPKKP